MTVGDNTAAALPRNGRGRNTLRRAFVALVTFGLALSIVAPAQAAPTTTTNTVTLQGASEEQRQIGDGTFCDDCVPDVLFDCGDDCEVAAGGRVSVFTKASWSAPVQVKTTADPAGLHQGASTDVTSSLTPDAGTISIRYRIPYEFGIFARNGSFPPGPRRTKTNEYTLVDTFTGSTSAPCTPRLAGDGTGTCHATDTINLVPETCFFSGCPVDVKVDLVVNHDFKVGPSGIVAHRMTTYSPDKQLSYTGATPVTVTDPISVPCSASPGTDVHYDLSGWDYQPSVEVAGSAGLHVIIDGPGPANADPTLDLVSGNFFSGTVPMSDGKAPAVLGKVLLDNKAPTVNDVATSGQLVEGSSVRFQAKATDNCPSGLKYEWSFSDGGTASGRSVSHTFGDSGVFTGTVTVSDAAGNSTPFNFGVTIENAVPTVLIDPAQETAIDEGETLSVAATFTDPGDDDPYTATIDYGDGSGPVPATVTGTDDHSGAVSGSFQYGDNGTYHVTVAVEDKDGGVGTADFDVTVGNVAPNATITNPEPVMADVNQEVGFTGNVTDPGSDDITSTWTWDDGTADDVLASLVNPPDPDPVKSPSVQPRDVSHNSGHTFTDACAYDVGFSAVDDDGGTDSDSRLVIITAGPTASYGAGYWQKQYGRQGTTVFTDAQLQCYLDITRSLSDVFDEHRSAATIQQAHDDIFVAGLRGSMTEQLDRQLLTAWNNFANGGVEYQEMLDTNRNGVVDTPFAEVMANAESVRIDPSSTRTELQGQRDLLTRVNERDQA